MGRPQKVEKTKLLDIARSVLLREGPVGAAKKIAKKAGISEAAVIRRLGNKADMLVAVLAPPAFKNSEIIGEPSGKGPAQKALVANAESLLGYFREAIPYLLPILGEPKNQRQIVLKRVGQNPALQLRTALGLYLETETKAGRISCPDNDAAASLLVFALYSAALFEALDVESSPLPRAGIPGLVKVLWQGLQAGESKPGNARPRGPTAQSSLFKGST